MTDRTFTRIFICCCFAWVCIAYYLGGDSKLRQHLILWPGAAAIVCIFLAVDKYLKRKGLLRDEIHRTRVGKLHLLYAAGGFIVGGMVLSLGAMQIYQRCFEWSETKIWIVSILVACVGVPIFVFGIRNIFKVAESISDEAMANLGNSLDNGNSKGKGKKEIR